MAKGTMLLALGLAVLSLCGARAVEPRTPPLHDALGRPRDVPRPAIILFWAVWCAPCRSEVAQFDDLDRAAGEIPVLVAPMEADRRSLRALVGIDPARLLIAGPRALAWMRRLSGGSAGLPVSVAIDSRGRVCAVERRALTPHRVAEWRRRCGGTVAGAPQPE